jgi:hypothetical protein
LARFLLIAEAMAYYRKVLSIDNDMFIDDRGNTAVLFINQRTGKDAVTKRPVLLKGTTRSRLFKKMKRYIEGSHAPVV